MKVLNLKPTKGVSRENFIFRGMLELSLWDLGGQERYIERYFSESQRELIFSEVTAAVFMVDSAVVEVGIRDIFDNFLKYLFEFSPNIDKAYVLLNKIDLQDSNEDEYYEILSKGLNGDFKDRVTFTPVSVKEGSAQHRLIEILDYEIQKSTLSMQRLGKIRHILDELKVNTLSEYLLFSQPDGLIISSTFGKFESKPLQFMKFEIGTLDSNIYSIYQQIMEFQNISHLSPLKLSTVVYESEDCWILVKEVINGAVLMAVTRSKQPEVFSSVINALTGEIFENLKIYLNSSEILKKN